MAGGCSFGLSNHKAVADKPDDAVGFYVSPAAPLAKGVEYEVQAADGKDTERRSLTSDRETVFAGLTVLACSSAAASKSSKTWWVRQGSNLRPAD